MKVGIIGGGISGVSLAFNLSQVEGLDVTLLEKQTRLGGCIKTAKVDGFSIEGGPNGFLDSKPTTMELFHAAGLAENLLPSNDAARKRFIMRDGGLVKLPEKPGEFFKSKLLSNHGKARVIMELLISKRTKKDDETIAAFARRRLGEEALEFLISPMVSGIFAGNPEKMSLRASFPVIYNLEQQYGGLFKAMLKKKKNKKTGSGPAGPGGRLTSYKGGMETAVNDLAAAAKGVKFVLGAGVVSVVKNGEGFLVRTDKDGVEQDHAFDVLAICAPAYASKEFLKDIDPQLAEELGGIAYAPAFVSGLGFPAQDVESDLDGFGYLIPVSEKRKILGGLFTSSIFPERAPAGHKLIRVISGGDRNHGMIARTDDELLRCALEDIWETVGVRARPSTTAFFRWDRAIPQYYCGHNDRIERIEAGAKALGNLFIGGNVLYGVGINDCTRVSKEIAEKISSLR